MHEYRPVGPESYRLLADIQTEEFPDEPWDPPNAERWYSEPDRVWMRFNVESDSRPVGFAMVFHYPWEAAPDRVAEIRAGFFPAFRTEVALTDAYEFLEGRSRSAGAFRTGLYVRETDAPHLAVAAHRGYREERRERFWELDLVQGKRRLLDLANRSRARMREQEIVLATIPEDAPAELLRRIHAMSAEAEMDVPTGATHLAQSFEHFMAFLDSPSLHRDRIWVAWADDQPAGLSMLAFPVERGIVATDWTGVGRAFRNRGIARALKLETIAQAIELGVDRVRTDNDSTNGPILHLNADLGYRHVVDWMRLYRDL